MNNIQSCKLTRKFATGENIITVRDIVIELF